MPEFFRGDATGLDIPADPETLQRAGPEFLTRAFRTFGSLGEDNAVARIEHVEHCPGGSTGAKLFMDIAWERPDPALHTRLFVKFARDFADERRDVRGWEMASEARFAPLSRLPGFPIEVPTAYFADYRKECGGGLIITERIAYGEGRIEPHRRKCLDHQTLADPLPHYRLVVTALARLAAAHKAGRLAPDIDARFPFNPLTDSADPIRYTREELRVELDYCGQFASRFPRLLAEEVRTPEFHAGFEATAFTIFEHEAQIQQFLQGDPGMIALCHWNAHIDNCWFEQGDDGQLHCGLTDWGRVGQITLGAALWGGLSAAHHVIWDEHLDELLALFVREYAQNGGPDITVEELLLHLRLHLAAMGVSRMIAFPEIITFRAPDCGRAEGPQDPMFEPVAADSVRNSLHIYNVFLKFWRKYDVAGAVEELLGRAAQA